MPAWLVIFLFALGAVALFVVGMSLTLMIKGHYIKSEIGENPAMRKRGIKCAAQQMREEDAALRGVTVGDEFCGMECGSCAEHGCDEEHSEQTKQ